MIGILHIQNQSYDKALIDNIEVIGSQNIGHAFHNDIVEVIDNKITKVIKSDIANKQIAGVLIKNSKYKYGFKKKGVELFLFKPLSYFYPFFLVASNSREKTNQYAIIQFLDWPNTNKLPTGQICRIIGDTDNLINIYEAIIYKNNLSTDQYKLKTKFPKEFDPITFFDKLDHKNITNQYVFSVDPIGCQDIDDALSIDKKQDHYLIGIHIADVSFYFDKFDLPAPKKYSTIYAPHKNYNMINETMATNICSLLPNQNRLAFTVFIKMSLTNEILDYSFEKTIINSKKAYSYEELEELLKNGKSKIHNETDLYNIGKHLYTGTEVYDTHKMIEVYMILANNLVGKYLYEKVEDKKKIIYRVHESNNISKNKSNNPEIDKILGLLESNAATYTNEHKNYYHNGLGIDYYTHFTSPIRRYIDIYIHRLLSYVISNNKKKIDELTVVNCDHINEFNKNIKKAEREYNKIELAITIDQDTIINAYVLEISSNKVTVYIPEYKIIDRIKLFNSQLAHLFDVSYSSDTLDVIEIRNRETNELVIIKKYELIQVKLVPTIYNDEIHKKIDIHIPSIYNILKSMYS